MGKLVVTEFVSIDGVFEDPGGAEDYEHGGWTFEYDRGEDGNKFKMDELTEAEAQLLGRVTYEGFAAAWPNMNQDEFGQKMNSMPKYVISSTLQDAEWENSTVIAFDEILGLQTRHAGDILIAGSGQLVRGLLAADLLDELRLMVYPVVLGGGQRLFGDTDHPHKLKLADMAPAGETVILTFARA